VNYVRMHMVWHLGLSHQFKCSHQLKPEAHWRKIVRSIKVGLFFFYDVFLLWKSDVWLTFTYLQHQLVLHYYASAKLRKTLQMRYTINKCSICHTIILFWAFLKLKFDCITSIVFHSIEGIRKVHNDIIVLQTLLLSQPSA